MGSRGPDRDTADRSCLVDSVEPAIVVVVEAAIGELGAGIRRGVTSGVRSSGFASATGCADRSGGGLSTRMLMGSREGVDRSRRATRCRLPAECSISEGGRAECGRHRRDFPRGGIGAPSGGFPPISREAIVAASPWVVRPRNAWCSRVLSRSCSGGAGATTRPGPRRARAASMPAPKGWPSATAAGASCRSCRGSGSTASGTRPTPAPPPRAASTARWVPWAASIWRTRGRG